MAEHPILFSGPMVRAILDGRKTQTRRIVTARTSIMGCGRFDEVDLDKAWVDPGGTWIFGPGPYLKAPVRNDPDERVYRVYPRWTAHDQEHAEPGDTLWVRETFAIDDYRYLPGAGALPKTRPADVTRCDVDDFDPVASMLYYRADGECCDQIPECQCRMDGRGAFWRPSIHMPRWASRLTLRVTSIRVERVQEISEEDARAEGCAVQHSIDCFGAATSVRSRCRCDAPACARDGFRQLWDAINGKRAPWESNPHVWVIGFEVTT